MKSLRERAKRKTELLSPAGSFDSARAAVNAGADAIYMGGPLFSARAFAESSESDMLSDAIDYCHLRGVRVFMTLNTLLKEQELNMVGDYLRPYAERGLDGVIVQDLGVMKKVRELYPEIELHISTQAAVTGLRAAKRYMELGAKRIVLARELSIDEIRRIKEETGAELEVFAHGALCYSYSGNCLMSSFIGGRSGNRGKCAGTCRLPFEALNADGRRISARDESYLLSMCDLNTMSRLAEMIDAGVYSFKIEGRMKSPVYTAAVTAIYRKYLDMAEEAIENGGEMRYRTDRADEKLLSEVFDRSGTTSAYLDGKNGRDMLTLKEKPEHRSRNEALIEEIKKKYIDKDIKLPVNVRLEMKLNERAKLTLTGGGVTVAESSDAVIERAQSRPATSENICEKLGRFGETDFEPETIVIDMPEDCFVPVSMLNELRRRAADELKRRILESNG